MRERLVESGYAAGWRLIRALPAVGRLGVFRAGADRAARKRGPGASGWRATCAGWSARTCPRRAGPLVRDGLRSYARYWLEAFRLPACRRSRSAPASGWTTATCSATAVDGRHRLRHRAAARRQLGLRRRLGRARMGWPLTTVAERLKPEGRLPAVRGLPASRSAWRSCPLTGGDRPPIDVLADALGEAQVVPLLADRDLSARGVEVEFFGGRTRMPAGPALLALRTGAPLFVVSLWYEGGTACGRVDGPLPIRRPTAALDVRSRLLTQAIADQLAEGIAAHPADWHMLQRLWLDEPAQPRARTPPQAVGRPAGPEWRRHAHRHRLPVLVRRPRRGAAARARPRRDADRPRARA